MNASAPQIFNPRLVKLTTRTGVEIRRTLPNPAVRTIGAWCFVDHFGPTPQTDGMVVAAHPHTGLQTATWLLEGEIEHRDSLGSVQLIKPGQLNLMTGGFGISHSELSQPTSERLHAVQLWIALPDAERNGPAAFAHHANLPVRESAGSKLTVFAGSMDDLTAPTEVFSDMVGAELVLGGGARLTITARDDFEYGLLVVSGEVAANGETIELGQLGYFEPGLEMLEIAAGPEGATLIILGGVPFGEKLVMWWNFIGRDHDEIVQARKEWNARGERFGAFADNIGGWIPAPELPSVRLRPRG